MNNSVGKKLRLGILVSHPIQYIAPLFRELAERPEIELTVLYRTRLGVDAYHDPGFGETFQWDVPLLNGYCYEFLSSKKSLRGFESKIVRALWRGRFDVLLVHGYNSLTNLGAVAVGKLLGMKLMLRGDTRLQKRHLAAPMVKRWFKRWLIGLFDGIVAIGSLNREYYLALGVPEDRLFYAPFSVDNAVFSLSPKEATDRRAEIRNSLSIPDQAVVVLYASKLTALKRPQDLLTAFAELKHEFPDAWLVIAGSGEEMSRLRALSQAYLLDCVRFIGFQNQQALPGLFAASDLFVLTSQGDAWGLVVNEAMAAGLPVIVTDEVGAAPDLVLGKGTGIVYPCGDIERLVTAMSSFVDSAELRSRAGISARQLIRDFDLDVCATAVIDAAIAVLSGESAVVRSAIVRKGTGFTNTGN